MTYWRVSDFAKAELARVDQTEWEDELFVLCHSPAARKIFAKAQYCLAIDECEWHLLAMDLFHAIDEIACDVAHRHPIAYHRWNPNRKWVPGVGKFRRLAQELGCESKQDEFGETFVRTIDGWWQV